MFRSQALAGVAALSWWLATSFAVADFIIESDVEQYNKLADDNHGFPVQRFRSSPVVAPVFHVNSWDKTLTDDTPYIFLGANYHQVGGGSGPMIIDASDLSLVYYGSSWDNTFSSEPRTIHGVNHLTFWAHDKERGGVFVVMDQNYNVKYNATAVAPHYEDMHELQITDEGTAVFVTHHNTGFDCRLWGGDEDCVVNDTGFQEVDLEKNEVIFDWWSNDHTNPEDTLARFVPNDFGLDENKHGHFDISHMNSAQKNSDGNYLISSRNFHTIRLINGTNGDPIWTLGGKENQFKDLSDGLATNFAWQHNARFFQNHSHITLFDNHDELQGDCTDDCVSRGLHLELDTDAMTARVVREFYHPGHLNSGAMGGMHMVDSGNSIVGWGWTPSYVEYNSEGKVALDFQRGRVGGGRQGNMFAYRVYKGEWTGRPTWPPSLAVEKDEDPSGNTSIYMSWNGATDIGEWAIFSSDSTSDISQIDCLVTTEARSGFETSAAVETSKLSRYITVAAIAKHGGSLGASAIFDLKKMTEVPGDGLHESRGTSTALYTVVSSVIGSLVIIGGIAYGARYLYQRWKTRTNSGKMYKYIPI